MSNTFENIPGRIFLTGMMGCGKSSTGLLLASRLNYAFVDTDKLIEERYGRISEIFEKDGEDAFRQIEARLLMEVSSLQNAVIATGGGMPCYAMNMDVMTSHGTVVYLKCSLEVLEKRLHPEREKRPLIASGSLSDTLRALLRERSQCYGKADLVINADGSQSQTADLIETALRTGRI